MGFGRKKVKKRLFGNKDEISPSCEYCVHSSGGPVCAMNQPAQSACSLFSYDPLLRTPRRLPPLREYDEEDFKL